MNKILTEHFAKHFDIAPGMYAGCRDSKNTPEVVRVVGVWFEDNDIINFIISTISSNRFLESIRDNKEITLVAANVMGYETYQYKGKYISDSPADENAIKIHEKYCKDFDNLVSQIGVDISRYSKSHSISPFTQIKFTVSEIFDQSPKIKAGEQVSGNDKKREDSTPVLAN